MIGELMGKEETNAALVVALSGTIAVLVAKGDGPLSLKWVVSGVLSNPIPVRGATGTRSDASVPDRRRDRGRVCHEAPRLLPAHHRGEGGHCTFPAA
jgi:hypothetical protein